MRQMAGTRAAGIASASCMCCVFYEMPAQEGSTLSSSFYVWGFHPLEHPLPRPWKVSCLADIPAHCGLASTRKSQKRSSP